ncbi:MAG: aminoacyltransferase, partial [Acidobacteria bacterium]|nr:aminoacyltransferase [Acidobacteriota bacterium]
MNAYPVQISGTPDARSEVVKHSPITINYYSEADAARWDRYVKRAPAATFCHQSGWMDVVERTWHYRSLSLFAERKEEIIGVLPLFHVKSRWFGSMLVSTPNAVYGGAVADDAGISRALVLAAQELALELDVDYLELRDTGLTEDKLPDEKFRRRDLYVTFEHPIDSDEDGQEGQESLMKSFPRDIRRMIRQGAKHGLSSEFGREELLDDFYDVYAVSVRNLG